MKKCTKCGEVKSLTEFNKQNGHRDGIRAECKKCLREYKHQYYIKKREKCIKKARQWAIENSGKTRQYIKKWRINNSERLSERNKKYRVEHHEQCLERNKKWRDENPEIFRRWYVEHPERVRKLAREYSIRVRSTPKGKLNANLSSSICRSLKSAKAGHHWEDIVGYTIDQLKKHIEKLFTPGMNWENYGMVWEIDHKIPIAVFNFDKPEHIDFRLCWSLKNLQPLDVSLNRRKSNKIDKSFQPALKLNIQ